MAKRISVPSLRLVTVLVVFGLLIGLGAGFLFTVAIPEFDRAFALEHESKIAIAQINHVDDPNSSGTRTIKYTYNVNGRAYGGRAQDVSNLNLLDVHYLASEPSYSAADPEANAREARFTVFWNLLLLTILAAGAVGYVVKSGALSFSWMSKMNGR